LKVWLAHPNRDRIIPDWLKTIISKYQNEIRSRLFGSETRPAIE
jgi:hypothetical protein